MERPDTPVGTPVATQVGVLADTRTARPVARRRRILLPLLLATAGLGLVLLPEGRLACSDPYEHEASPDGAWTLTLCRRPKVFSMPGGSSDAPGWIVLRDVEGSIAGVVDLGMVQNYRAAAGAPTQWTAHRVDVLLTAQLPLVPASGPVGRWVTARVWRWRALLGLVPTDDMFR